MNNHTKHKNRRDAAIRNPPIPTTTAWHHNTTIRRTSTGHARRHVTNESNSNITCGINLKTIVINKLRAAAFTSVFDATTDWDNSRTCVCVSRVPSALIYTNQGKRALTYTQRHRHKSMHRYAPHFKSSSHTSQYPDK